MKWVWSDQWFNMKIYQLDNLSTGFLYKILKHFTCSLHKNVSQQTKVTKREEANRRMYNSAWQQHINKLKCNQHNTTGISATYLLYMYTTYDCNFINVIQVCCISKQLRTSMHSEESTKYSLIFNFVQDENWCNGHKWQNKLYVFHAQCL